MADYNATVAALRTHLETNFTSLPLRWPNDPRDASLDVCPNGFVYSEIDLTSETPVTIGVAGTRTHRDTGAFNLYLYVPRGTLPGVVEQYAETLRDLFTVEALAGIVITSRRIGRGEVVEGPGGRFYCVPLMVEFFTDRIE